MTNDAVIVGINAYPGSPLGGCVADATDISECLNLGFYDFYCEILLDSKATRAAVLSALGDLIYAPDQDEDAHELKNMLVIYFAGHGTVLGDHSFLVTYDGTPVDPGISLGHLAQIMESASKHYRHVLAILDCCHAGDAITWTASRPISSRDIDRDLPSIAESRCVLAACRPEQFAYELPTQRNGVFTAALVEGMLGSAVDFVGEVTLMGLHDYVSRSMAGPEQTPVFKGDVAGTVVLGRGLPPRKGPPIPRDQLDVTVAKGRALLDEYGYYARRELGDRSYRAREGLKNSSKRLEPIVYWFRDTEVELPDLSRDTRWGALLGELRDSQNQLCDLAVDTVTKFGEVERHLGHGGFGHVWKIHADSESTYAYKVFHGNELDDALKVQRFLNGYQNMRKLEHPRIVKVHELTFAPYGFIMDEIPGENLRGTFVDPGDPEVVLRMMADIAETVQHAHLAGVRHRDIKPENIIVVYGIEGELTPYLTDFDLAYHETNRTVTSLQGVGGVINYAAPEQMYAPNTAAARADTVDIYSMAQLMYFLIVGEDPSGDDFDSNQQRLRRRLNEWVDPRAASELMALYQSSTARAPEERPQNVAEFAIVLSRAETYVLAASGIDDVPEQDFCRRFAHQYAGIGRYTATDDSCWFLSLSGQVQVALRHKGQSSRSYTLQNFELEFNVTGEVPIGDLRSSAQGRNAINNRLDRALRRYPKASRHAGSHGAFQTFISIDDVELTLGGLMLVAEVMHAALTAVEHW